MSLSNYLENQLITHIFRSGTFSKPTTVAVALLTAAPSDTSTGQFSLTDGTEVANANGYARVNLGAPSDSDWSVPSTGTVSNSAAITFPTATGSWGDISHVALVTSATWNSGNLLAYMELDTAKTIVSGDTVSFGIGQLNFALD